MAKAYDNQWRKTAVEELKKKMFAKSTSASKESKRMKIWDILGKIMKDAPLLPLTADYAGEAKLTHIESGFLWSQTMERKLVSIKRALRRGVGPDRRALEHKPETITREALGSIAEAGESPEFPIAAFMLAAVWMLRCAELIQVRCSEIKLLETEKCIN